MNNGTLKMKLESAITPYFQGFMKSPAQMSLAITVDDDTIDTSLTMAPSDVAALSQKMGIFTTTIRNLADFIDGAAGRTTLPVSTLGAGLGLAGGMGFAARAVSKTRSKKKSVAKKPVAKSPAKVAAKAKSAKVAKAKSVGKARD